MGVRPPIVSYREAIQKRSSQGAKRDLTVGGASGTARSDRRARLCMFPGLNVPCGVQGAVACRPLCGMKAGGALEIAWSDACVTTMRVSRTRAPEQGLGQQSQPISTYLNVPQRLPSLPSYQLCARGARGCPSSGSTGPDVQLFLLSRARKNGIIDTMV